MLDVNEPEEAAAAPAAAAEVAAAPAAAAPAAAAPVAAAPAAAEVAPAADPKYKPTNSIFTGLSRDRQSSRHFKEQRSRNLTKSTTCKSFLDDYKKCDGCKTTVGGNGKVRGSDACEKGCVACGHGLFR